MEFGFWLVKYCVKFDGWRDVLSGGVKLWDFFVDFFFFVLGFVENKKVLFNCLFLMY